MKKLGLVLIFALFFSGFTAILAKPNTGYAPEVEEIDWSGFWVKFRQYSAWRLEWYNGSDWVKVNEDLSVIRDYPEPNHVKLTLVFDASHAGNYRLTFGIDKAVKRYVTKVSQYQYSLEYDDLNLTFDWSDAASIPGIVFSHGVQGGVFWFRMSRDNVPLGAHVEIDPGIIIDSYADNAQDNFIREHHPSGNNFNSSRGETFRPTVTAYLTNITLYLKKSGSPTCNLIVRIYDHNGTFGTTGLPTGDPLANSSIITANTIGGAFVAYNFSFIDEASIQLNSNTSYVFALEAYGGVLNASDYVIVSGDKTAPTYEGNHVFYNNNAWKNKTDIDLNFIMYGENYWGETVDLINDAFEYFGIFDYITLITEFINNLTDYFEASLTHLVALTVQQFRVITNVYNFVVFWTTELIGMALDFSEFYQSVADGTSGWDTGIGDFWDVIEYDLWAPVVPLLLFIWWFNSIEQRARQTVGGELQVFIGDMNTAISILSYFISMFSFIANTIIDRVYGLFNAIV